MLQAFDSKRPQSVAAALHENEARNIESRCIVPSRDSKLVGEVMNLNQRRCLVHILCILNHPCLEKQCQLVKYYVGRNLSAAKPRHGINP